MADETLREKLHRRIDKLCDDLVFTAPEGWPERAHVHLTMIGKDMEDELKRIMQGG